MPSIGPYPAGRLLETASGSNGFLLMNLGQQCMRQAREALARYDLNPRQLRILDLLGDRGAIGQRELGELMAVDQSVLVNLLNPLEAERLIKRDRDASDRRRHMVSLTTPGQKRLALASQAFRDGEDAFFASLTAAQRDQLRHLLLSVRDSNAAVAGDDCD